MKKETIQEARRLVENAFARVAVSLEYKAKESGDYQLAYKMLRVETDAFYQDALIIIKEQKVYLSEVPICSLPSRSGWMHTMFPRPDDQSYIRSLDEQYFKENVGKILSQLLLKNILRDDELKDFLRKVSV